eukprot:12309762-Ditylum_brightwellii.AAC.1
MKFGITVTCPTNISDTIQALKSTKQRDVEIQFADKGRKENNLTLIQVPASWPEILMNTPPNHDLEDLKSTTEWKTIDL